MLPKNSKIVRAEAVSDDTILLIVKTPCRHYSMVEITMDSTADGNSNLFITNVENRCGISRCAKKIF